MFNLRLLDRLFTTQPSKSMILIPRTECESTSRREISNVGNKPEQKRGRRGASTSGQIFVEQARMATPLPIPPGCIRRVFLIYSGNSGDENYYL